MFKTVGICLVLICVSFSTAINWQGDWAFGCDFNGHDLTSIQIRGEDCGGQCSANPSCTHYSWTSWGGGTCWLKQGDCSKDGAIDKGNDQSVVCGVTRCSAGGSSGSGSSQSCGPNNDLGVGYEPFHSQLYPLNGGDGSKVPQILDTDLKQISQNFGYIRTYYAAYYGTPVAPVAAKYGLKVYLGVYPFDNQDWFNGEIQAAVNAAKAYPGTVKAIIFGNENLPGAGGSYSVDKLLGVINNIKGKLRAAGVTNVPVGTAQRITEWVDTKNKGEMDRLANGVDIIGVHIYPFFSPGWNSQQPTASLDGQWSSMLQRYPGQTGKIRILESGWPSQGGLPSGLPASVPNDQNQKAYYNGFKTWKNGKCDVPRFWFMAFDRRGDDPFLQNHPDFERYFGVYKADNSKKPVLI